MSASDSIVLCGRRCVESGLEETYKLDYVPEPKQLEQMWNKSPMKFIKNVS